MYYLMIIICHLSNTGASLAASFANVGCFASTSVYPFNTTYSHDITEISLKLESATRNRRTNLYPALFIRKTLEDTKGVIKAESKSKKDIQYNEQKDKQ